MALRLSEVLFWMLALDLGPGKTPQNRLVVGGRKGGCKVKGGSG